MAKVRLTITKVEVPGGWFNIAAELHTFQIFGVEFSPINVQPFEIEDALAHPRGDDQGDAISTSRPALQLQSGDSLKLTDVVADKR